MLEHRAHLAVPSSEVLESLAAIATRNGYRVTRDDGVMTVAAPLGTVTFTMKAGGAEIVFAAASAAQLQVLKDLYAERFGKLGVSDDLTWQAGQRREPLNQVVGRVVSSVRLSPNFQRLRLEGAFSAYAVPGAGLHFRLLIGEPGAGLPTLDDRGITEWPGGVERWHRPPYTARAVDPGGRWLDIDIVLHEGGRVTDWCQRLVPGEEVALHGPSGSVQPTARWLGLIGDETALPVIMRMIEDAPAGTSGQALVMVRDPADAQVPARNPGIALDWVLADEVADPVDLVRRLDVPADGRHLFFAAERAQATRVRAYFKEAGFPSRDTKAASYWTDHAKA
ncbi:MAG: siderophore-interacting protein [Pseudomonadota bacterium]